MQNNAGGEDEELVEDHARLSPFLFAMTTAPTEHGEEEDEETTSNGTTYMRKIDSEISRRLVGVRSTISLSET